MGVLSHLVSLSAVFAAVSAAPAAAPVAEPMPATFEFRSEGTALSRRAQAINYNQDYIAGGANVQYSPNQGAGSFSISYNTNADFVVGLGWQPGDKNPITFSGSFTASGVGIVTIYGWSTNPLVEYYIMENPIGYPKSGTQKGTVTSDGSSYEVWLHQQVNQPSIQGTSTFNQFISIRSSPRNSGTVTIANHFNAWAGFGMTLGTLNYQVLAVESWSGSGSGSFTVSKGTSTGTSTPPATSSTTSTGTGTGSGSGSGCAALYGQCGGQSWTGTTCCSSGTCKAANSYYSQCL